MPKQFTAQHAIKLEGTNVGKALHEIVEDNLSAIFENYTDPRTQSAKSTITVTVTVTPRRDNEHDIEVAGSHKLPGKDTYKSKLYVNRDPRTELMEIAEGDPRQLTFASLDKSDRQSP